MEQTQEEILMPDTPGAEEISTETPETPPEPQPEPDPLTALKQENGELSDRLLRVMAEYDNFRKRSAKERETLYPEAEAGVIARFLPFVDHFERAMQSDCTDSEYKKGMEMIWQSFGELLTELKVEPVGAPGEPFDPKLHNAVMHIEDDTLEQNVVAEVFQKGYRRGERILRYAMVKTAN